MVYEAREGEVILLGASAWRIEQITHDRVLVIARARAAGQDPVLEGRGSGPADRAGPRAGRLHAELAEAEAAGRVGRDAAEKWLRDDHDLDELAAQNLLDYLAEEREVTGALPTDQTDRPASASATSWATGGSAC